MSNEAKQSKRLSDSLSFLMRDLNEFNCLKISSGSDTIIKERNRLLEQINEIQVRYEQVRLQLEEVSRERDFLQSQNKATVEKVQTAMDEMSQKLEESQNQNKTLLEEVNTWRESGEIYFVIIMGRIFSYIHVLFPDVKIAVAHSNKIYNSFL